MAMPASIRILWVSFALVVGWLTSLAHAEEAPPSMLYDLTIETRMPNLEESLRYADTKERRCLRTNELARFFPILEHESFQSCRLVPDQQRGAMAHELLCTSLSGTRGEATWIIQRNRMIGTLTVKLGGKNMTFFQRVTAHALEECSD